MQYGEAQLLTSGVMSAWPYHGTTKKAFYSVQSSELKCQWLHFEMKIKWLWNKELFTDAFIVSPANLLISPGAAYMCN